MRHIKKIDIEENIMAQDLTKLPLHQILIANGFTLHRSKSSMNWPMLCHKESDLKLVVSKKGENYLYFNPHDPLDKGNIISFARIHNKDIKELVANFDQSIKTAPTYNHFFCESQVKMSEMNAAKAYKKFAPAEVKENKLLAMRGFDKDFIIKYQGCIKEDSYHNLIIPNYKFQQLDKELTNGQTKEMLAICGYTKRLILPITQDKMGNALEKPLKNIQYGSKGIEILNTAKDSKDIKHIIITESIFDSLALTQMKDYSPNQTLLLSTAGAFGDGIKQSLKHLLEQVPNAQIMLGFDNDEKGKDLSKNMSNFILEIKKQFPITYTPFSKDCNDDLKLQNITSLKEINKQTYHDWIDLQIVKYKREPNTQKRADILQKIRKADNLMPIPQEKKDIFNKIPKHKAIKSL